MNKKISILIISIILLSLLGIFLFFENKKLFKIENITCKSGEEINISIKVIDKSNFVAGNFEFIYDKQYMEYVSYSKGGILKNSAMDIINNDINNSKVLFAYVSSPGNKENIVEKGELINMTFKIKEEIDISKIKPIFKCTTLKDKEGNDIKFLIDQGIITVK